MKRFICQISPAETHLSNKPNGDSNGEIVKSKVKFLTNAEMIAERIARKCVGGLRGAQGIPKPSRPSEVYPEDWCKEVLRGLRDQMEVDGRLNNTGMGCVFAVEEGETEVAQLHVCARVPD